MTPRPAGASSSKAYDIVAYGVYFKGSGHGLQFFPDQKERTLLTPATLRQLANAWDIPEKRLAEVVSSCVDQAMRTWPDLLKTLPLTPTRQARCRSHPQSSDRHRFYSKDI